MFHYVYITTNLINGKKYIGKHSFKRLENRYIGSGTGLKAAIKKYGRDNFVKEIISIHDTEDQAYKAEELLVEFYNAVYSDQYYNQTTGGRGAESGRILSEEHKQKIGSAGKGRKLSEDHKQRLSEIKKRNPTGGATKGKPKSDTAKQKMSDSWKTYPRVRTEEIKDKISKSVSGERNGGYGKRWINNGTSNDRIYPNDPLPEGWQWGKRPYGTKRKKEL